MLALKRAYPDYVGEKVVESKMKITRPMSVPGSPRSLLLTPGDLGSLQDANQDISYFELGEEET